MNARLSSRDIALTLDNITVNTSEGQGQCRVNFRWLLPPGGVPLPPRSALERGVERKPDVRGPHEDHDPELRERVFTVRELARDELERFVQQHDRERDLEHRHPLLQVQRRDLEHRLRDNKQKHVRHVQTRCC